MKMRVLTAGLMMMIAGSAWAQDDATKPAKPAVKVDQPAKDEKKKEEVKPLKVGDKAPTLTIEKWVKGEPVTGFEKGKVYVVEFWATWCGPCIKAFPHLSELQKKYKDKGLVIIGTNIWEDRGEPYSEATLTKVKEFVEKQGDKMAYTVAYDGGSKAMDKSFMKAAGRGGIPSAFIVNQEGVVAWMGHPAQMDEPLDQIIAGKYDIKAAAEKGATAQTAEKVLNDVRSAMGSGDSDKAVKVIDDAIAKNPKIGKELATPKFQILLLGVKDTEKASAWALEAAEKYFTGKGDAEELNGMAWMILDNAGVEKRDYKTALKLAEKAVAVSDNKDGMIMDTLALAQFENGDIAKAVESQKKAIELSKSDSKVDEQMMGEMKARLEKFEKAQKDKK